RADQITVATEIYQYRALDIDVFVELALLIYADSAQSDLSQSVREALHDDLITHRARCLLFKDIHDIQRDYRDNDVTPVLAHLEETEDAAAVATFIDDIANRFSYSADSRGSYRNALLSLERRPDSVVEEISGQMGF
ncbi:hypothetical protein NDI56_18925, partial [Haloarcula sp. S1CR25-12]